MGIIKKSQWGAVLAALLLGGQAMAHHTGDEHEEEEAIPVVFDASLTLAKKNIALGESPEIILALKNISDHTVQVDEWVGNWMVRVTRIASSATGEPVWKRVSANFQPISGRPPVRAVALAPGKVWEIKIRDLELKQENGVSLWKYPALESGDYVLSAVYSRPLVKGDTVEGGTYPTHENASLHVSFPPQVGGKIVPAPHTSAPAVRPLR